MLEGIRAVSYPTVIQWYLRFRDSVRDQCSELGLRGMSRIAWLPVVVVGTIIITITATMAGFIYHTGMQRHLSALRVESRDARIVQLALLDVETGARGFVISSRIEYLQPYSAGLQILDDNKSTLSVLDRFIAQSSDTPAGTQPTSALVSHLRSEIGQMVERSQAGAFDTAEQRQYLARTKATMDILRSYIGQFLMAKSAAADAAETDLELMQEILLVLQILSGALILTALSLAFRGMARQSRARAAAIAQAVQSREKVEHLFTMTDMLQSAAGYEDANAVLRATARRLLPGFGGALYIFNNSRDRLDLSTTWGAADVEPAAPRVISPTQCWALKRGKSHMNAGCQDSLRCGHAVEGQSALEIPMLARGEIYGLLQIFGHDITGTDLETIRPLASALADSMSLALSSIALRERLRNQALRDPLTGLYNRRFMEEVLESFALQAERRKSPISAIMIDLDHFKQLNDTHGHAAGDAVLRDVAGVIQASLRKSDVACRYGGEELIVLLPDSDLEAAQAKAEAIRTRIAELSSLEGVTISASLGVASIPKTSSSPSELTAMADEALYKAKESGRNKVMTAPVRRPEISRIVEMR
jgi:diguanylate cyclase (GGDEF)-like protein